LGPRTGVKVLKRKDLFPLIGIESHFLDSAALNVVIISTTLALFHGSVERVF
jgi:hypothetical protein